MTIETWIGAARRPESRQAALGLATAMLRILAHAYPACGPLGLGVDDMADGLALVGSYRLPGDRAESRLLVRLDADLPPAVATYMACRHFEIHLSHVSRLRAPDAPAPASEPDGSNIIFFPQQIPPREVPLAVDLAWRQLAATLADDLEQLALLCDSSGFCSECLDRVWLCPNCGRDAASLVVTLGRREAGEAGVVLA